MRQEKPSLANGFVNAEEIKDLEVAVFVSHNHPDHFDPVILSWRPTVKNITYLFGWNARKGERSIDMPAPRAMTTIKGLEIYTVNGEHDTVPEVAYLVKVDGLSIYHSGDYVGRIDRFRGDMDYLLDKAGTIDIAFMASSDKPRPSCRVSYSPFMPGTGIHVRRLCPGSGRQKLPSRVICPENKGDRFMLSGAVLVKARDPKKMTDKR